MSPQYARQSRYIAQATSHIPVSAKMDLHLAVEAVGIKHGGGATVLADFISAALADDRFSRISVFCSPRSMRLFDLPASSRIQEIECLLAERSRFYRWWWLERRLAADVAKIGADVVLCFNGAGVTGAVAPSITFIQQSLPFSAEAQALMSSLERLRCKAILAVMNRSCRASRTVLVQTGTMKSVVAVTLGIPPEKIEVVPPVVRELKSLQAPAVELAPMRSATPGFRLLYVGNASSHKNVEILLSASATLRDRFPEISVFLTWPRDHQVSRRDGIVCLGYLNAPLLAEAYQLADIFVMPSLQETVGLPMLEAMGAGLPVLAADRPYAREICGDTAIFFDPLNVNSLVSQLEILLRDHSRRRELKNRALGLSEKRRNPRPYGQMLDAAARAATAAREANRG